MSDETFLSRWSRRKTAAKAEPKEPAVPAPAVPAPAAIPATAAQAAAPLPPVETLTPESDFTPFLREGVEEQVKRAALKTLFQDPRFNVMDGLDVYIDDYSKPDPLPEGWLEKLNQMGRLGEYREPEEEGEKAPPQGLAEVPEPDPDPAPMPPDDPAPEPQSEAKES